MTLVADLLWLCSIPSPTGSEQVLCAALEQRLRETTIPGPQSRRQEDCLVLPLRRGTGGPHIALMGHIDVVPTTHDGPPRIEGDRLYGPGASDMKGGLAMMLDLAKAPPVGNTDLTLVFYAGEEGPFEKNQLGGLLGHAPELNDIDLALMLEPCDNALELGCGGSLHATVRFRGKSAHSARPWQGVNAIHLAADLLTRLAALEPTPQVVDNLTWHESISATRAFGGQAPNVIPEVFELNLNHRFGPNTSLKEAEHHLSDWVGPGAEVVFVDRSPSAPPLRSHPLLQLLEHSGVREVRPKLGWTDVARCAAQGIPAANFGPGAVSQCHQRNEWASIEALEEGQRILRRFLEAAGR